MSRGQIINPRSLRQHARWRRWAARPSLRRYRTSIGANISRPDILFLGELPDGGRVEAVVTGDRDPGYGSASKMIAESALCLVRDVQGEGGIWTPGALMGPALRKRLTERAGLTFSAR